MLKVLLADDEIFTIRMLQSVIHWNEMGLEIAGYAQDGETAYEMAVKEKPDIIISDIRMPEMDGIAFLKKVRSFDPGIKTILMSAYADFSYVKEGMKLGCSDYILKPVDETELEQALRKVIQDIHGEKEQKQVISKSVKQLDHMNLYQYMRTGHGKNKVIAMQNASRWQSYSVFFIQTNSSTMNEYTGSVSIGMGHEGYFARVLEETAASFGEDEFVFDYEENCWIMLLTDSGRRKREEMAKEILDRMHTETGLRVKICFSSPGHSLEELPGLYEEVRSLSKYSFYVGEEDILGYGYNCDRGELNEVRELGTLTELRQGSKHGAQEERVYSRPVAECMQIIEKRYHENLSLEEICAKIAVSKNYFCYLFKRETGISLWNYLAEVRLQHAKKLLEETELKSYEIAFRVGYDNPSYFSKMFKKYENMTPNEYRESRRGK